METMDRDVWYVFRRMGVDKMIREMAIPSFKKDPSSGGDTTEQAKKYFGTLTKDEARRARI